MGEIIDHYGHSCDTRRVASGTFRRIMRDIMEMFPAVTTIAQTIQLSLSPVFMLAGIGAILNVLVARLARVVDRARALEMLQPTLVGEDRTHHAWELRLLHWRNVGEDRTHHAWELRMLHWRMKVINTALFLCASSAIATWRSAEHTSDLQSLMPTSYA